LNPEIYVNKALRLFESVLEVKGGDINMDYKKHNDEVEQVWESYNKNDPIRVPMILGISAQYNLSNPYINSDKVDYEDYCNNPEIMAKIQMKAIYFKRMYIQADHRMGPFDENEGYEIFVDFQNYHEAAWFGCPVIYKKGLPPYAAPFLTDDNLNEPFDKGLPDPFGGIMGKRRDFYEYMLENAKNMTYEGGRVVSVSSGALGTDGPFTIACSMRGATNFCMDLYIRPDFARQLLEFITEATIKRIKAWWKYEGRKDFAFADDSIALISLEDYKRFVLPVHKKLAKELCDGKIPSIHLCGDATRHFKTIRDELGTMCFDTGYPVLHGKLQQELGPDVRIQGGPHVELIKNGNASEIRKEVKRILEEVKPYTKKFILREGNNVAPGTPVENLNVMYEACKEFGRYK